LTTENELMNQTEKCRVCKEEQPLTMFSEKASNNIKKCCTKDRGGTSCLEEEKNRLEVLRKNGHQKYNLGKTRIDGEKAPIANSQVLQTCLKSLKQAAHQHVGLVQQEFATDNKVVKGVFIVWRNSDASDM